MRSRPLIVTQPNLSPPTLISGWGSDTLALQSHFYFALTNPVAAKFKCP
jgi:hypothetical protein